MPVRGVRRARGVFVWKCPTCARQVAREQERCPCGYLKVWRTAASRTSGERVHTALHIVLVAVVMAVVTFVFLRMLN